MMQWIFNGLFALAALVAILDYFGDQANRTVRGYSDAL